MIRYDNRDTGRSTSYPPGQPGYAFTDLAGDAIGILDALDVDRAHIVCRSMSGGIGLIIGADHPDRVASLTFVSTSTGDGRPAAAHSDELADNTPARPGPPRPRRGRGLRRRVGEGVLRRLAATSTRPPTRALVERDVARTRNIASTLVNHYAMDIDGPPAHFGDITAPTLVVHGDHDPVFPSPTDWRCATRFPARSCVILEGAGHELPKPLWDVFVPALLLHTGGGRP